MVMCNLGIAGIILWIWLIKNILRYNESYDDKIYLDSILVFYICYSCITGDYGYMKLFLIFYILMLGESMNKQNKLLE